MVTAPIPQHRHCQVCGKAVRSKEEMCSPECKAEWDKTVRRKQYTMYAYLGFGVVIVVLILLGRGNF